MAKITHHLRRAEVYVPLCFLALIISFTTGFMAGSYYPKVLGKQTVRQQLPIVPPDPHPDEPLRKYSIQNLQNYPFQISEITVERVLEKNSAFTSYLFSYRTLGKKMTGQMNVPAGAEDKELPVIVLVRGYVDVEEFKTGVGTAPVAAEFAKAGYVTFAPDFLGFGGSDVSGPGWEARFEKPVNVIELIQSLRKHKQLAFKESTYKINPDKMGIWAHSNGGQITLTTLEALGESIPATLWAPVTAPFPYSVLYYSDEMEDGGASLRATIAGFEQVYNVQEYSLTQYLPRLRGPLQLHQGTADDSVPKKWSDEFVKKIREENDRRNYEQEQLIALHAKQEAERKAALAATASAKPIATPILPSPSPQPSPSAVVSPSVIASASASPTATGSARLPIASNSAKILADNEPITNNIQLSTSVVVADANLKPIDLSYFVYQGGSHFIRPGWEEAVARDLVFFEKHLNAR